MISATSSFLRGRQGERGLNHGEREAFRPESIQGQVLVLDLPQMLDYAGRRLAVRQQFRQALLGLQIEIGVTPKRIVRIEAYGGNRARGTGSHRSSHPVRPPSRSSEIRVTSFAYLIATASVYPAPPRVGVTVMIRLSSLPR
jgi:hypothetical protein